MTKHLITLIMNKVVFLLVISVSHYTHSQKCDMDLHFFNGLENKVDTTRVHEFFNQLKLQEHQLHSVLVLKNGVHVFETYFKDDSEEIPHDLRSVTKSIRSLLIGIAIDKGWIENVNDPISKYLKTLKPKKNVDVRKSEITIKHLLTMSSGLDCNDRDKTSKGQEDKVHKKKDWLQYTIDLPMLHAPGKVSSYCSMGSVLAAEIISQASGVSIQEFAHTYLFQPLGIKSAKWGHTRDDKAPASGKRLYLTSRDMAKIGQLVLQEGCWKDKQIVSRAWIAEATTPKTKITGIDYGYLWWQYPFHIRGGNVSAKLATGNGGQYIMVFPTENMVAVFTGGAYNSQDDKLPFAIMQSVILPTFMDGE